MLKIISKLDKLESANLVYLLEKKSDLKSLDFLKLDKKILNKISDLIKKGKNIKFDFFLGQKNIETLEIVYFSEGNLVEFLGKNINKSKTNTVFMSANDNNLVDLLKVATLSQYSFDKYKSKKSKKEFYVLENKNIDLEKTIQTIENVILARDLGEMPSSDLYPEAFSKLIKQTKFKNTKVKILSYKDILKNKMGLINGVGKGSSNKPNIVILEKIVDKKLPTIALVGKGVTFDTGGIQVKPGDSMYEMKGDMCGAANVFAIMKELDKEKLNVNVVACLGLAENHISGDAYKPSDILTSYNKKTVDVIHTDAEGRLVLADCMSYVSDKYNLDKIITVATLTGACMVALGYRYAGIMGNDDKLINKFIKYSNNNQEKYCRLPFDDYFIEKTKSEVADLENLNRGVMAGSTMGAAFLSNFLDNGEKYIHLDIAGPALNSLEAYGWTNKGTTGFGVLSISEIIKEM